MTTALKSTLLKSLEALPAPLRHAVLFGSLATSKADAESDIDLAVDAGHRLSVEERLLLIDHLAEATGRPVDLVDLHEVGEPLLGEILRDGIQLIGTHDDRAQLLLRHWYAEADFVPMQRDILATRRQAWIGV